jgi:UDP-N-acetylmuramoyl-tripeptide--D-alanyl-D-alanine ligase
VTGSVGKTTVKEMLRAALSPQGRDPRRRSELQQPLGRAGDAGADAGRHGFRDHRDRDERPGEIAPLARMAAPDVAIVTTVAPAHLEAFGVIEGIAHGKRRRSTRGWYPGRHRAGPCRRRDRADPLRQGAGRSVRELIGFGEAGGRRPCA